MAVIPIEWASDNSDLLSDIQSVQAQLRDLAQSGRKSLDELTKAEKKAADAADDLADATDDAGDSFEGTGSGLKSLGDLVGIQTDQFDKLGEVMGAMGTTAGAAVIGFAAAGAALVGMAAGMVAAVKAAGDLVEEMEPLEGLEGFEGLPKESLRSIQAANDSMAAMSTIGKRAIVVLGAEFAPIIEEVSVLLLKFGLMALDAFQEFADGKDMLRELAVFMTQELVQSFLTPISVLMNLIGVLGELATALGNEEIGEKLSNLKQGWEDLTRSVAETAVDSWFEAASDSLDGLGDSTVDYDARARELINTVGEQGRATGAVKEETDALALSQKELNKLLTDTTKATEGVISSFGDLEVADFEKAIKNTKDSLQGVNAGLAKAGEGTPEFDALTAAAKKLETQLEGLEEGLELAVQVDPSTVNKSLDSLQELELAVQQAVPSKGLSKLDELNLLLLRLQTEASKSAEASAALADEITAVEGAIEAASEGGDGDGGGFAAFFEKLTAAAEKARAAVEATVNGVVAGVKKVIETFSQFLELTSGVTLEDLFTQAMSAEGDSDMSVVVDELVEAATAAIDVFVSKAPLILVALAENLGPLIEALAGAITPLTNAVFEALSSVFDVVASEGQKFVKPLQDLTTNLISFIADNLGPIVTAVLDIGDQLVMHLHLQLPTLISAVLSAVPEIIDRLLASIGDVVHAVLESVPQIIAALIAAIPSVTAAVIASLPELILQVYIAIHKLSAQTVLAIMINLIKGIDNLINRIVSTVKAIADQGLIPYIKALLKDLIPLFVEWIKEVVFTAGDRAQVEELKETVESFGEERDESSGENFGDTPGAVTAGLSGLSARFAPGDTVVAAQDPKEALRQAQRAAGVSSNGPSRTILDLRDGHLAFDRLFRRNIQTGGALSSLLGPTTGQVKVFG